MDVEAIGDTLAGVNASLNTLSACLLVVGYVFVKRGDHRRHRASMLAAVASSALFLVFYLTRVSFTGTHRFAGEDTARSIYFVLLASHVILAATLPVLVPRLLFLAFRERFDEHRRLARWVYPTWMYVSVTGLVVYVMLYRIYGYV